MNDPIKRLRKLVDAAENLMDLWRQDPRIALNAIGAVGEALKGAHASVEQLELEREALEQAARALVADVHESFPEGLEELGGIRPYIEALERALEDQPDE